MTTCDNLGLFEKWLRKSYGYSLENVAHDIEISKSFLSDAEKGRRVLKPEIFSRFLEQYKIDFSVNKLSIDKAKSLLDAFVSAWIDRDLVDEEKTKRELAINRPALQNSLGCLYLLLIDIFLSVHLYAQPSDVQVNSFLEEIENYLPLFSQDEQALISFLKGFEVMKKKKYQAALDHYEKALRILDGKQWPELEGIIKFHLAHVLGATVSFFQAYKTVQEARSIFVNHNNHIRMLFCDNNSASYLISMHEFEVAKNCIHNMQRCQKRWFHDGLTYSNTTTLMIIALTLEEKFEHAIEFARDHPFPIENGFIGNLSLIPYCYYRLEQNEECLKSIEDLSKEKPTDDDRALFEILKRILNQDSKGIENAKIKMMQICVRQKNWCMLMVLYQLMIAYYESKNEVELLNDAYRQQARIYRHQLPV